MSKSATEQFQIKKKRKHPLNGASGASVTVEAIDAFSVTQTNIQQLPIKRYAGDTLIKENFSEFQIDDKYLKHSIIHFKPITTADEAADIFVDSECIAARVAAGNTPAAATPQNILKSTASLATNCLRDKTQAQTLLRGKSPAPNNISRMPLQHGFYVKGASASKRALKSPKMQNGSPISSGGPVMEAKKPRRSIAASEENAKLRPQSLMTGQTAKNLQLSYLLGESLARHGRLQEAFDIYALIASEQPKGFIPLEKLNILATALLEHIRLLSCNSKKSNDTIEPDVANLKSEDNQQQMSKLSLPASATAFSTCLATQWQLAANSLTNAPSYTTLKPLITDNQATVSKGGSLDLHNPTRELARTKSPSLLEDFDPLVCPLCRDILRCPVTANCGHTFCRQCCETITMCNICHIKFPRWQKEELAPESSNIKQNALHLVTLSTATSTTTSSSSSSINPRCLTSMTPSVQNFSSSPQQIFTFPSNNSSDSHESSLAPITNSDLPRLHIVTSPLPPLVASPTTVTTTTIACTTDTATTTMAATSSSTLNISGGRGGSCSSDNMKFMPDVLVRRLVEKWWGPDLQAKKILETATSYMHLNHLDDALKFCNVSLEKGMLIYIIMKHFQYKYYSHNRSVGYPITRQYGMMNGIS